MSNNITTKPTDCLHKKYIKSGKDRHGNQRYKCKVCNTTWVDKRRDNRVNKSMFLYTKDMLIDWLDGHSYRTIARNYKLTPYYVNTLFHYMLEAIQDNRHIIYNHEDWKDVKAIGIDAACLSTNKGKVCYLLIIELDTNTPIHYQLVESENTNDIYKTLEYMIAKCHKLKYINTDLNPAYKKAIKQLNEDYCVDITHVRCRVHMLLSLNRFKGVQVTLGDRRYRVGAEVIKFEDAVRGVIFSSNSEESYNTRMLKARKLAYSDATNKALNYIEKNYKQHLIKQIPRYYQTNNLVESWWNLIKTKFKTARSLDHKAIDKWFNLFLLRFHLNHLDYNGKVVDNGKSFKIFNCSTFEDYVKQCEPTFKKIIQQHNFKRS